MCTRLADCVVDGDALLTEHLDEETPRRASVSRQSGNVDLTV